MNGQIIQLDAEPAAYRYIFSVVMLPHVQATMHDDWKGAAGFHELCNMLDAGHVFLVPVVGGTAAGLAYAEVVAHPEESILEGHLAFFRKIAPSDLQAAMKDICEWCSYDFDLIRVVKNGMPRAARMFVRRAGFEDTGGYYIKRLRDADTRRKIA